MPADRTSILICCIGNELVADDGAAIAVYRQLQARPLPASVRLQCIGIGGLDLLDYLTGAERALIVVDAVQFGADVGTVHCLDWQDLPPGQGAAVSAHALGLREAIELGQTVCPDKLPKKIVLVGIEGRNFHDLGGAISSEVAAAVPRAADCVQKLLGTIEAAAD